MTPIAVTISGLGMGLPERVVTNAELASRLDTSDDWITARTGIRARRVLGPEHALSHLAIKAGRQALDSSETKPQEIDLVIVATLTPDTFMPATACRVAAALECHQAGAFDLNIACSGFLYGLLTAVAQMESGLANKVLVIGGDTLSRIVNWDDRRTAVLFGDSAGAAVLEKGKDGAILGYDFGADGASASALAIAAGPSLPSEDPLDYKVTMDGRAVFRFASNVLVESCQRSLKKAGVTTDDVDLIIPHQANLRILESASKRLGVPMDRFYVNLDRFGNTSAGSIPVALCEAHSSGRVKSGAKVLLAGFGGGLSWGSILLRWA